MARLTGKSIHKEPTTMVRAIVGANWGDEGKGKITDLLAERADCVVRYQGGANAGHTIINDYGKFALHLLPSGAFRKNTMNIIGSGVALYIPALLKELGELKSRGVPTPRLMISDRAQILMPYHIDLDGFEEDRLAGQAFGSTRSGMAPFYADKAAKIGFQVAELFGPQEALLEKLERVASLKDALLVHLYKKPKLDPEALLELMLAWREQIRPFVGNVSLHLYDTIQSGGSVLLEGQLGALRDPEHGIYPYSTSSSTLAGYATVGAGVAPGAISSVTAVTKAYSSCVGAGPFVGELDGSEAETLRNLGGDAGEYGATTGRPRRMAWFDCVATRYGCRIQGATEVALTNLDVLGSYDELKICVAYELDGKRLEDFPSTPELERCTPLYETLPGWSSNLRGVKDWDELPQAARDYVAFVEKALGVPVSIVSTGPERGETIFRTTESAE